MKADLTRLTFDRTKHYRAVQQQQGRVQLDSDWNEQNDITAHRVETETVDVVGTCGAPLHDDGFRLVATAAGLTAAEAARPENKNPPPIVGADLLITGGRFYAGGVLTENDRICLASAQPDLPSGADTTKVGGTALFPLKAPGTYLAYLDVWPRLRTASDDDHIREVALGGPDTATRAKNTWQVKFLAAPDGANCSTSIAAWDKLLDPKPGTLAASVKKVPDKTGPCIVDPGSGYRRLENQLYRVEVHTSGDTLAKTTLKWSRDNGTIASRWLSQSALGKISVETTGRDKVLNLAATNWIELTDDAHEELGLPGVFASIATVQGNVLTLNAPTADMDFANFPKNPKVRRWESAPASTGKWITPDGQSVNLNTTDTFELEDGVVVQFGAGSFRTGDYWLIPARTALPNVDWPTTGAANTPTLLPPQGIEHHYCKLAIVEFKGGVFKISDCRSLFPPLTELTELFYVSGDAQQVTPNPTQPPATLYPLALPLTVGIANGEWPVAGARVRFNTNPGGGVLTPADGMVITGADGLASCQWSINSATPNPEVVAQLLDSGGNVFGLPVIFHATLNVAKAVAYDPANCEGMSNATPPVVTVQDALDFLCHEKSGVDCCVTIGKIDDRPGDYETVADALEDLLLKRKDTAICLSLLPGDHVIEWKDPITPASDNAPLYFKIDGCSHASRLIVKQPLLFKKVSAVVIRDISILVDGGEIDFDTCLEIEISSCDITGRTSDTSALLQFRLANQLTLHANQFIVGGTAKSAAPENVLKGVGGLDAVYKLADDRDFEQAAEDAAVSLAKLTVTQRARMVKDLDTALKAPDVELSTDQRKSYVAMIRTLGTEKPTAKTLAARLKDVREKVAPTAVDIGNAIVFADFAPSVTFSDNRIGGLVSFGGRPAIKPLTNDELKAFAAMVKSGGVEIEAAGGKLRIRGNEIYQFVTGDLLLAVIRALIKSGKGTLGIWASAQHTDNIIAEAPNFFLAQHLSLNTTVFLANADIMGFAIANTATYIGNNAEAKSVLRSLSALAPVDLGNQGVAITPI